MGCTIETPPFSSAIMKKSQLNTGPVTDMKSISLNEDVVTVNCLLERSIIRAKPNVPERAFRLFTSRGFTFLVEYFKKMDATPLVAEDDNANAAGSTSISTLKGELPYLCLHKCFS